MTTKTTNTTNDAGVPPATPEAHQRAGVRIEDLSFLTVTEGENYEQCND